jgi:hypothetical protein
VISKAEQPGCRRIAFQTLKDLGVDSFFYPWSWVYFKNCATPSKAAMVLLNTRLLTEKSVQGFGPNLPAVDPIHSERVDLVNLQPDISRDDSGADDYKNDMLPFWPGISADPKSQVGVWESTHLLGCDGGDQPPHTGSGN